MPGSSPQLRLSILLRLLAVLCLLAAAGLTAREWTRYQSRPGGFPPGTALAGIPVGGLTREEAAERLRSIYGQPVELRYGEERILAQPAELGFQLDLETMVLAAEAQCPPLSFWDFLWNRTCRGGPIKLAAGLDTLAIQTYLDNQIAPRYGRPPSQGQAYPGTVNTISGQPGEQLNTTAAVPAIAAALYSQSGRTVSLPVTAVPPIPPSLNNLAVQLQQVIRLDGYSGLVEVYIQDLSSGESLNFALQNRQPVQPGIAFTAASTIKIPILLSAYRRLDEPAPEQIRAQMALMILESDNAASDAVAREAVDPIRAPLVVSEDLQALGLQNTFWAGFFEPGAALLQRFDTPANRRTDVITNPDIYTQVTPAEIGFLLGEIQACATERDSAIGRVFAGQVSPTECQAMLDLLLGNHNDVLLQGGLPDGTPFAHKHGWVTDWEDGLIHHMSDVGIVTLPGEGESVGQQYVIAVYFYDSNQLLFEPLDRLAGDLSTAAYNFFAAH